MPCYFSVPAFGIRRVEIYDLPYEVMKPNLKLWCTGRKHESRRDTDAQALARDITVLNKMW